MIPQLYSWYTGCFLEYEFNKVVVMRCNILIFFSFIFIMLSGCGGGSDGASGDTDTSNYGVFYDSRVSGLEYRSPSYSGVTDQNGEFPYQAGETIRFSVGGIEIGETEVRGIITPMTLVGVSDPNNDTVVNIIRFLQTLDDDADPQVPSGIVINEDVRGLAAGHSINFNQTIVDFENDSNVLSVIAMLTEATSAGVRSLVPSDGAIAHLNQTMSDLFLLALDTYSGSYGSEQINCTDNQDHSFVVAQGDLQLSSRVMNSNGASVNGTATFIDYNYDVVGRYEFTFNNLSIDYLGNINGIAAHSVYENDVLVGTTDNFPIPSGQWDGNSLIIRFQKSTNVGVTESGDVRCDSGAIIRVSK